MSNYRYVDGFKDHYTKLPDVPIFDENLTSDAKVVLLSLFLVPYNFHITIESISRKIGMSENRVNNAIKRLKKNGYISVERLTNEYGPCGYYWHISGLSGTFTTTDEVIYEQ